MGSSNTGIQVSGDPDVLKSVWNDFGHTRLAVWDRLPSPEVKAALEKFAFKSFFLDRARARYTTAFGRAVFAPFNQDAFAYFGEGQFPQGLREVELELRNLKAQFAQACHPANGVQIMAGARITGPGKTGPDNHWRYDSRIIFTGDKRENTMFTGVSVITFGAKKPEGGEFLYVAKDDEDKLAYDHDRLQYKSPANALVREMPVGAFGIFSGGEKHGLRHNKGAPAHKGYKCLLTVWTEGPPV